MSRLDSDLDYLDWLNGPYPTRVERTCARCGETFLQAVEGEYEIAPWCEDCQQRHIPARKESA